MNHPQDSFTLACIAQEQERQQNTLNFIASENYASKQICTAVGSVLTNKYAEGYPQKRYYAGCSVVDEVESIAQERAQALFGVPVANVQPHAGSQANFAAYQALIKPGDTILGMSLAHGGHLTHGHKVNISGSWYNAISYGLNPESELIDYDEVERLAHKHRPQLIIAGASSYSRIIDFKRFSLIAKSAEAFLVADIAHIAGLVAAHLHPSPVPYADIITSTTHKTLRGPRGGLILAQEKYRETINRAIMPGMQGGPFMHVIAGKAMCFFEAMQPNFITYQKHVVNLAHFMAQAFTNLGYRIISGGTENHLFVIDLQSTQHSGKSAERLLEMAGITVSRSCIPYDPRSPAITSGIRLGSPAMATRGMTLAQAETAVNYIDTLLKAHDPDATITQLAPVIKKLAQELPLP
jgi:glycine hydroxymethyltransferase